MLAYATLALGSAFAAFMYPHTLTGVFASKSDDTIRKNAILLPVLRAGSAPRACCSAGPSVSAGARGRRGTTA